MSTFAINLVVLSLLSIVSLILALSLVWRVGSWQIRPAFSLNSDEGVALGQVAPQLAAHAGPNDFHLSFGEHLTLLVFGGAGCEPCQRLLDAASSHPALRAARLVYVGDKELVDLPPEKARRWEAYRFHDESSARRLWKAPVSPYFHLIGVDGRVLAKGVANSADHLDSLFVISPVRSMLGVQQA